MIKVKKLLKSPLALAGNFLILFAPLIVTKINCITFWGEPECPECLMQDK